MNEGRLPRRRPARFAAAALAVAVLCPSTGPAAGDALRAALADAPANRWVRLAAAETGGRRSPMLFYAHKQKRFVVAAGVPVSKPHYVVEELDPATGRWANAYPPGAPAGYAPASGPTDAPPHPPTGWPRKGRALVDKQGVNRLGYFGDAYAADSRGHFQYAYVPPLGKLLAYLWNRTLLYDPVARTWTDLAASPSPADHDGVLPGGHTEMIWGSLCYDPVNHEVVSLGGTSATPGGSPGTWVYSIAENRWRRLPLGSKGLNELRARLAAARTQAWDTISACRNRLHVTETKEEHAAKLSERLGVLREAVGKLAGDLADRRPTGDEGEGLTRALAHARAAAAAAGKLAETIDQPVTAETVAAAQAVFDRLELAARALAVAPPARALSRMACDASARKIVLFGGDGLDRHYADTWVYDCPTRTWRQRWPRRSPSPRAGNALVYLPKARKILLLGGYGLGSGHSYMYGDVYRPIPFEMWTYDTARNEWSLLQRLPLPKARQPAPHTPRGDYRGPWPAVARDDDSVVLLETGTKQQAVWVCKVDAARTDANGTAEFGAPAETTAFRGDEDTPRPGWRSYDPAFYDRGDRPDLDAVRRTFADLPANTWQLIQPTKGIDQCGWGTTAYDADRRQLLYWGGGHSEYKGTNVFHYSLRANRWSSSCRPDWVLEWSGGFLCPALVSFRGRPHVPVHAYQGYAYDPTSGFMVVVRGGTFLYRVADRRWEARPVATPFDGDVFRVSLETTPGGVICWAAPQRNKPGELYRFDAAGRAWRKLPRKGPAFAQPWCDGSGMCYDARRDCLWIAPRKEIFRYDLRGGQVTRLAASIPQTLGKFALYREQVHVPPADLILLMRLFRGPGGRFGNVAYDPAGGKWHFLELPFVSGGKPHTFRRPTRPFSWSSSLHYDAQLGVVLLHEHGRLWALRLDRETARMTEIRDAGPPRRP